MSDTDMTTEERQDTAEATRLLEAGRAAEAEGNRWQALEHYEAAFEADPENAEVCFHLAYLLDLVGDGRDHTRMRVTMNQRRHVVRKVDALDALDIGYATPRGVVGIQRVGLAQDRVATDTTGQHLECPLVQLCAGRTGAVVTHGNRRPG